MSPEARQLLDEIFVPLGGTAIVLAGLCTFVGKLWVDRLMAQQQAHHAQELKELESSLRGRVDAALAVVRTELDLHRGKHEKAHAAKLESYSAAIECLAKFFAAITANVMNLPGARPVEEAFAEFELARVAIYGRMAPVAPQSVMDPYDRLIEQFLDVMLVAGNGANWQQLRALALDWINAARADLAVNPSPIVFNGRY